MNAEERIHRLETILSTLLSTLIDRAEGMDGDWGRPPYHETLVALKEEMDKDL
jgi:hypothetical protein